jgi:lysozyme family protein
MKENFDFALTEVLKHEGGYVNHPRDPGGATNRGVTQATYDRYRRSRALIPRDVRHITWVELKNIYKNEYWHRVRGDDLPDGLDLAVFDFAVNSGPARAAQFLQRLAGAEADGLIGPATLRAVADHRGGLIDLLCDTRLSFLKSLKHWDTFGKGWSRRIESVRRTSKRLEK